MSDSADHTLEAEPLKGDQVESNESSGSGCCGGKVGVVRLSAWRTAAFLISMFLCLTVVFAFSFILPCPVRPQYRSTWNLSLPSAVTYDFLAIGDGSKDKVLDVFLIYKSSEGHMNRTCKDEGLSSTTCLFLLAVDGTDGVSLWEQPLAPEFNWAECGVGGAKGKRGNLCVVAHADNLTAVDMYTGDILWQSHTVVANDNLPVISLPDLNDDKTNDIAVMSYPNTNMTELVFISGKSGDMIGSKVKVGVASRQLKSHLQFSTTSDAEYILLHTDSGLYAMSLGRLADGALSDRVSNMKRDKSWEQRADNQGLITLYNSSSSHLQSVLKVRGGYSPSLLLHTESSVMLFDTQKLSVTWTTNASNLVSTPTFGHFNNDGVPDIVIEEDQGNTTKRVVIIDGQKGSVLWDVFLPYHINNPQPASVLTLNSYSVFMLWGEPNDTNLEVEKHSTFLLHPLHPDVLLERRNSAQHIINFKALLLERGRHAGYLVLSGGDGTLNKGEVLNETEYVLLTKRKIKGDVSRSRVIGVHREGRLDTDVSFQAESVKEAFYRLRFSDQSH